MAGDLGRTVLRIRLFDLFLTWCPQSVTLFVRIGDEMKVFMLTQFLHLACLECIRLAPLWWGACGQRKSVFVSYTSPGEGLLKKLLYVQSSTRRYLFRVVQVSMYVQSGRSFHFVNCGCLCIWA